MTFSPFRIEVPDDVLDDLRARLARTRLTSRTDPQLWRAGADPDYLGDLVAYWADGFDWRAREAALNAFPHYLGELDGRKLHFLRIPGERAPGAPAPLPLLLSHGWPSSFVEMLPLVDRLTNPVAHGGAADDAFDVVIPSLPGFLFSELPAEPLTRRTIGVLLHRLMTEVLGYERYGAFGGDIGGGATLWLGALYSDHVAGIHLIHPPRVLNSPELTAPERAFLEAEDVYDETDGGYSEIMCTRPDTIAAALVDSPAGLAAWIVDKFRDWTDNGGDLERSVDRDTLLTNIMLYWATGTIGSSFRQYYDYEHNPPLPQITVPAAVTLSAEPVMHNFPRQLAERRLTNLHHWHEPGKGGHFMPLEEPDLVATELRTSFRPLR